MLLAGCIAVFKKRAGMVLLHAGVGLMMFYDVLVGRITSKARCSIVEGETTNFSRDMREAEFDVIDRSDPKTDQVTAIDGWRMNYAGAVVRDSRLPFDIEVFDYFKNSELLGPREPLPEGVDPNNPATAGIGKQWRAINAKPVTGTDIDPK